MQAAQIPDGTVERGTFAAVVLQRWVNYHYSPTISSGFCEGLLLGMITNKKEQLGYLTDKDREKL